MKVTRWMRAISYDICRKERPTAMISTACGRRATCLRILLLSIPGPGLRRSLRVGGLRTTCLRTCFFFVTCDFRVSLVISRVGRRASHLKQLDRIFQCPCGQAAIFAYVDRFSESDSQTRRPELCTLCSRPEGVAVSSVTPSLGFSLRLQSCNFAKPLVRPKCKVI